MPFQILGTSAKQVWTVPITIIMPAYTEKCCSQQNGFHEISYLGLLIKFVNIFHVLKKWTKITVTSNEHLRTFLWGTTWCLRHNWWPKHLSFHVTSTDIYKIMAGNMLSCQVQEKNKYDTSWQLKDKYKKTGHSQRCQRCSSWFRYNYHPMINTKESSDCIQTALKALKITVIVT